jgi:hypothetical protein
MELFYSLALANLLSSPVLFFALGFLATLAGSHMSLPEGATKMLAVYLMMAIGFKGGVSLASSGLDAQAIILILCGMGFSAAIPILGFTLLKYMSRLNAKERAAVAAHYGSVSIVTFGAASEALKQLGIPFGGYMVAVTAAMETPAILAALFLIFRGKSPANSNPDEARQKSGAMREVFLNATIVILIGSFLIGAITGDKGMKELEPFVSSPYKGVLSLFLLDMGTIAARGMRNGWKDLSFGLLSFAIGMPLFGACLAAFVCWMIKASLGDTALFITLAASASYIAVPAAMRLAVPDARPSIYLMMSLGLTFPFNLVLGIPVYVWLAQQVAP